MAMAASALTETIASLDVFVLTFNAGKQHVDPSVFAYHLRDAFARNTTGLPELIVFCLQEMAPLAESFIGPYMISSYYQKYASAVNLAASHRLAAERGQVQQGPWKEPEADSREGSQDGHQRRGDVPGSSPYTLVTTRNVGMTGIMLFARDPNAIHDLQSTEVGFGAGGMANKGAVGLRLLFSKEDAQGRERQTELTFVGTHLTAHEWNLENRNRNWETIVSGLLFGDPSGLCGAKSAYPTPHTSDDDDEAEALLSSDSRGKALRDITIYKPGSHLFVAGDLNYRISKTSPTSESKFPSLDPESPDYFTRFLALDQLTPEKAAGRTLHGLHESPIHFPPTYKLEFAARDAAGTSDGDSQPASPDVPTWDWASHRWPGWCDRVLYLDIPRWASGPSAATKASMDTIAYDALPPVRTSDHRAVFLYIRVPVLEPSVLAPSPDVRASGSNDPRLKPPYPVDFEAWTHRARMKKWESMIGWSMFISQSKQGIALFTTLFLVGLGTWWLRSQ
ncbi:putative endonuclease exonuclease phosphatase [Rosellinia necatrix]|uniref:Putative endonuclease exonuclease phosphatase n=1 Tax=Rosellinia necatrix TaxID=77044 RepID=A0A1W2TU26_ROSNE|nr:putative endonuclease exonuclease phosphatase [Rosellinia necatrix]